MQTLKDSISALPVAGSPEATSVVSFALQKGALSDNGATPWFAVVGLGTPNQSLKYMIDTGTTNTWVTAIQCTTNACQVHGRFNSAASSSYNVIDNTPTQKDFGPWGTMTVVVGEDIFNVEQITEGLKRMAVSTNEPLNFELATYYTGCQFQSLVCDGGIAVPSPYWTPDGQTEALMLQLYKDGKIGYLMASFYTNPYDGTGECLLGGVNYNQFNVNTLQSLPLQDVTSTGLGYLWSVELGAFLVNGVRAEATINNFVLDTGSSYFKGPKDLIQSLVNTVTNNGALPTYVTTADALNNYPTISLVLGNQTYTLTPQQYFLQLNSEYWELGIQVLDGMPEGMLLVGSVFLDTVYSIFDYANSNVWLAEPIYI